MNSTSEIATIENGIVTIQAFPKESSSLVKGAFELSEVLQELNESFQSVTLLDDAKSIKVAFIGYPSHENFLRQFKTLDIIDAIQKDFQGWNFVNN